MRLSYSNISHCLETNAPVLLEKVVSNFNELQTSNNTRTMLKHALIDYLEKTSPELLNDVPYVFVRPEISVSCFVADAILCLLNIPRQLAEKFLLRLKNEYLGNLGFPYASPLNMKLAHDMLSYARAEFTLDPILACGFERRPLRIFNIPHAHPRVHGLYNIFLHSIVLYQSEPAPDVPWLTPEMALFHELGHSLLISIGCFELGKQTLLDSFDYLLRLLIGNNMRSYKRVHGLEACADWFAIAVVSFTPFEDKFSCFGYPFSPYQRALIKRYFLALCEEPVLAKTKDFWKGYRNIFKQEAYCYMLAANS